MLRCSLPLLIALFVATPAMAIEVRSGISGQTGYDSNAVPGGQGDMVVEVRPRVEVIDPDGTLTWGLRYNPIYRYFVTEGEDGGFSHIVAGEGTWSITPTLEVSVSDRFARLKNIDLQDTFSEVDPNTDFIESEIGSRRTKSNIATGSLRWFMTPRDSVTASVRHNWRSFDQEARGDQTVANGTLSYQRGINSRNFAGVNFSYTRNETENLIRGGSTGTDFYNLSGTWSHTWDSSLSFSIAAGPTFVVPDDLEDPIQSATVLEFPVRTGGMGVVNFIDADSCSTVNGQLVNGADCGTVRRSGGGVLEQEFPGLNQAEIQTYVASNGVPVTRTISRDPNDDFDDDTSSLTYFANVSIRKEWGRVVTELAYLRRASTSAAIVGSNTVADEVRSTTTWKPTSRINLRMVVAWVRRDQEFNGRLDRVTLTPVNLNGCILVAGLCSPQLGVFRGAGQASSLVTETFSQNQIQDQYFVLLNGRYKLRRNLFLTGTGSYRHTTIDSIVLARPDLDRWRVLFGIEYRFDPILL